MEDAISKVVQLFKKKVKHIDVAENLKETRQEFLRSRILGIDWVMMNKGIPIGKLTEVYGDYSSGKSWFCYRLIGEAQRNGFVTVLLDTEGSFVPDWARKCSVDTEKLILFKPFVLEEVFDSLFSVLKELKDERLFVVWDSLAMTPSEKEMDDGFDKRDLTKAQVIGQGLRMLLRLMEDRSATVVVVNQLREKIGQVFGDVEFTPGGRALGYATALRLRFWKKSKIRDGNESIGQRLRVECTKSKVYEPFRWFECDFLFGRGVSSISGVLDLLERLGYVVSSGGWYKFEGQEKKWRRDDFYEMLYQKDEYLLELLKQVFDLEDDYEFEIS